MPRWWARNEVTLSGVVMTKGNSVRDIKFRGLEIRNREWVYGNYSKTATHGDWIQTVLHCNEPWLGMFHEVVEGTICQYTGLKDKNGSEIYEGDFVLVHDATTYEVCFGKYIIDDVLNYGWYLCGSCGNKSLDYFVGNINKNLPYEVVGCIHI